MIRRSPRLPQAAVLPRDDRSDHDASIPSGALSDSPAETAAYIAQMMAELAVIARHARLDLLAYFIEMARVEAATRARMAQEQQNG